MFLFMLSLGILAATVFLSAVLALWRNDHLANKVGAAGSIVGCVVGFLGVAIGLGSPPVEVIFPWTLPFGAFALGFDQMSRLFLLPVFGLGAICAASGASYMEHYHHHEHNAGAHWLFYTLLILALALTISARDAALFLLSWELMSLAPFFLIEFHDNEPHVREASRIYLMAAHLGAVFLMVFFLTCAGMAQSTSFAAMKEAGSALSGPTAPACLASLLFICALLGFGAKAGLAPVHIWLPEAYPAAPSHISALLSGAMINVGLYGFLRALEFMGPAQAMPAWWGWLLLFLGLSTGIMGILKALAQANLKRLLAYSSVENMGIIFMGVGVGLIGSKVGMPALAALGFGGALLHMLNHSAFKSLLFLCAGEILHCAHSMHMEQLGGLQKRIPLVGLAFAVGTASIACLPPFNGFAGEFVLIMALAEGIYFPVLEGRIALLAALAGIAVISGLAAVAYVKAYGIIFLGEPRTGAAANCDPPEKSARFTLGIPAFICIAAGIGAPLILGQAMPAVEELTRALGGAESGALTGQAVARTSAVLFKVILIGLTVMALAAAFMFLRRLLLKKTGIRPWKTWDCGYAAGTSRIQYTGASFSEPISNIFGSGMGLSARQGMDKGYFPAKGRLELTALDRLKELFFTPLFEAVRRACDAAKVIQHGRIHLYILYILVTAVLLLFWGLST